MKELELAKLSPEAAEGVCSALRTWAPVLADFYRALLDSGTPPDLATQATTEFFTQMLAASWAEDRYTDD